jgi:hypothetical protein
MIPCNRFIALSLFLLLLQSSVSIAQIELSTRLDHNVYLQFEPVLARTSVKSSIGQAVVFNSETGEGPRFYYRVNDDFGHQLPPLPDVKRPDPVLMPAQATIGFTNNMLHLYQLSKPGFFSIQPCVDWMGKTYAGEKQHIEVVVGREVMRVTGRVPSDGTTRTYKILHINRKQQDHILLRIDDEEASLCYGVFSLGRSVMSEKTELVVDGNGNAHVLYKTAPTVFNHLTYTPFGALVENRSFGEEYSVINLQTQPDGSVKSSGRVETQRGPKPVQSIIDNR